MKTNLRTTFCAFLALFTCLGAVSLSASHKTPGQKLDQTIDKSQRAAEHAKDKAKDKADDAKDKAHDLHERAKEKAHKGIEKL